MSENKSIFNVCLDPKHWNIFDITCAKCQSEVKNSGLLTECEFSDWLDGKINLGFDLKMEAIIN